MEQGMEYLGIKLRERHTNYLYRAEKICAIMEDTGELIPVKEVRRYYMAKPEGVVLEEFQKKSAKKPAKKSTKKTGKKTCEETRGKRICLILALLLVGKLSAMTHGQIEKCYCYLSK